MLLELIIPALVVAVIDGDTAKVKAEPWPNFVTEVSVRVEHIDAPEHDWRANCDTERQAGERAKLAATSLFQGQQVFLRKIKQDKFGGRIVAEVWLSDGQSWGQLFLENGLAKPYEGGTKPSWCAE